MVGWYDVLIIKDWKGALEEYFSKALDRIGSMLKGRHDDGQKATKLEP